MIKGNLLPAWVRNYRREWLAGDVSAGFVVGVMLVPQSLAYALLAGLPPQAGLYASILPVLAYALLGSSMTLAVGPVAAVSLMTASALAPLAMPGSTEHLALAMQLALLSGLMLCIFGALRLGMLAHFLSHPVMSGFISGAAVVIIVSQLKPLLGLQFQSQGTLPTLLASLTHLPAANPAASLLGVSAMLLLAFARGPMPRHLHRLGLALPRAQLIGRLVPVMVVVLAAVWVAHFDWHRTQGVAVVGAVSAGLPSLSAVLPGAETLAALWLPALLISVVSFVESVSVAQALARHRGERITPDRELFGLGAANLASGLSGAFPVAGGFSRSVVNFSAGARTPLAGVFSAGVMALVLMFAGQGFAHLPTSVLAAAIIVAVWPLIDIATLRHTLHYDRGDAIALIATFAGVVVLGVEQGILGGVIVSFAVLVWRSARPHIAVVGRVPGTEHFRNIERYKVDTLANVLAIRVDENLFFGNADAIETALESRLAAHPQARHLLLIMSAVNRIDTTALDMLSSLEDRLGERGIRLAMAEIKSPVMERLAKTDLGARLAKRIWLSAHEAFTALAAQP